jgi:hypothetical protein
MRIIEFSERPRIEHTFPVSLTQEKNFGFTAPSPVYPNPRFKIQASEIALRRGMVSL